MKYINLEKIYTFLFAALVFLLPFQSIASALPNIVLVLIILVFPFIVKRKDFSKLKTPEFLVLLLLVGYLTARLLWYDLEFEMKFIKKIIPAYLIFILAISLKKLNVLAYSFIISVFTSILISSIKLFVASYGIDQFQFAYGSIVNNTLIGERIYIGFMGCMSVIFSYRILKEKEGKGILRILLFLNILSIFIFLILIVSRMALFSLLIILFFIGFGEFKKIKHRAIYITLLILTLTTFSILNIENISRRLNYKGSFSKSIEWARHREPRVLIWECSYNYMKSEEFNFLLGNGHQDTQKFLNKCYNESIAPKFQYKKEVFARNNYNTHNQYIDFFLSTGLIGVVLFILFFILFCYGQLWKIEVVMVVGCLILFTMIENIFHRQLGFYLFSLMLIMARTKVMLPQKFSDLKLD